MDYTSTRADSRTPFADVVASGMAPGGGLYMPRDWPQLHRADLARLADTDYADALARIATHYDGGTLSHAAWGRVAETAVEQFRHPAVAPLSQIGDHRWLLELFHGPTLSFKDYGLQPLARLLAELRGEEEPLFVLGATSGDTGSAGIAAFAETPGARVAILHPHGRVSEVQRRQMTTVADENVVNIAVDGSFDDCQRIVKSLLKERAGDDGDTVLSVNSINWGRLLFQAVYYLRTAARLARLNRKVAFVIPSGNFGNAFAATLAVRMGARIERLVVATNSNDFLARVLTDGTAESGAAQATLSPAMDIQIPSNLERLVYLATGENPEATAAIMASAERDGRLTLPEDWQEMLPVPVEAVRIDDDATQATIRAVYAATDRIIDPHTAVAVAASDRARSLEGMETAIISTAHPAKFPEAVESALGFAPPLPAPLAAVYEREERLTRCAATVDAVRAALRA